MIRLEDITVNFTDEDGNRCNISMHTMRSDMCNDSSPAKESVDFIEAKHINYIVINGIIYK